MVARNTTFFVRVRVSVELRASATLNQMKPSQQGAGVPSVPQASSACSGMGVYAKPRNPTWVLGV